MRMAIEAAVRINDALPGPLASGAGRMGFHCGQGAEAVPA
jgi:hypothetical protein